MIVIIDTNVFVRDTHLLRKKGGRELVQLLRATKGQLLIPEILRREYVEQTIKMANEERSRVNTALSTLDTLLGVRFDRLIPDGEAVQLHAVKRLSTLDTFTLSDPLTPDLLVAAGTRSVENRRPSSKTDHGYKDCLIWESVLRLPHGSEVRFISRDDKAFFNGDAFDPGLISEALVRGISVVGYRDIDHVVEELTKTNPDLNFGVLEAQNMNELALESVDEVVPPAPAPRPSKITDRDQVTAVDVSEVARKLSDAQKPFDGLDLKVLAYIAYLDSASKADIFGALADTDVAPEIAKNVAERLALNGFIRDTGNHYFVVDRAVGELAAPTVEAEIIAWLEKKRRRNGK